MNAEREERIAALFAAALEHDAAAREMFLRREAGDPEMAAEVASLLEYHTKPGLFDALVERQEEFDGSEILGRGTRVGAWEIVGELASGGMGTVYRARRADGQFEQDAALKIVARHLPGASAASRFLAERQILARLAHPNIARLLDGGVTAEDRPYYVMELVDGVRIDEHCDAQRLDIAARLRLFLKVCDAVQSSHRSRVVHRDLKPANILVTRDGEPKLLDFGIAKLLDPDGFDGPSPVTRTTARVLTPEYASPEQLQGRAITAASDVYQLGLLLYALLVGRRPYGATAASPDRIDEALSTPSAWQPSRAVSTARTDEPTRDGDDARRRAAARGTTPERLSRRLRGDLDDIVLKTLRPEPDRRYGTAGQLADDIGRHLEGHPVRARPDIVAYRTSKLVRRHLLGLATPAAEFLAVSGFALGIRTRTAAVALFAVAMIVTALVAVRSRATSAHGAPAPSVAVLPFVADPEIEPTELGRDVAERVRETLNFVPGLEVMPEQALAGLDTRTATGRVVQRPGGRAIVDGSLRLQEDRVLVTVRLLDGRTGEPRWTGRWDRPLPGDPAAFRDELSLVIADTLRQQIAPFQPKTYTENRRAYDRFLQGVYAHRQYTNEDIWTALQFYREAWEEDPRFALAHAIAGNAYIHLTQLGLSPAIGFERAREHVLAALAIDSTLAEGHAPLGFIQIWGDGQFDGGERSLRRSIMLYPTLPQARDWYGWYALDVRGWRDAAVASVRRALDVDPLNAARSHTVEWMLYRTRRYDEVAEQNRVTWSLDSEVARSLSDSPLAHAYREQERYGESIAEFRALQDRTGGLPPAGLAVTFARMGRKAEARAILHDVVQRANEAAESPIAVARIYANLGDFDQAFHWLERTWLTRPYSLLTIRSDPALDTLRSDPRFDQLMQRLASDG